MRRAALLVVKHFMIFRLLSYCAFTVLFVGIGTVNSQLVRKEHSGFLAYLSDRLATESKKVTYQGKPLEAAITVGALCPVRSRNASVRYAAERILREYGALFAGDNNALLGLEVYPYRNGYSLVAQCIFLDAEGVRRYQSKVRSRRESVGGVTIELEEKAMDALLRARQQAATRRLSISPRGGRTAATRSYADTKRLWDSRFFPALDHWVGKGVISQKLAGQMRSTNIIDQVAKVLELEDKQHAYFSRDLSKSILYSVAAPGASQHLFMLALDVREYANPEVRGILAANGWYQTVKSDLPHFTYLGITDAAELSRRGLVRERVAGQDFWIPRIE